MDNKGIYLFLVVFVTIVVGLAILIPTASNVESINIESDSSTQSILTDNGTATTLSPVGDGITSFTSATTKNNSWLSFDGLNDYVNLTNNTRFNQSENITIIAWVKSNNLTTALRTDVVTKGKTDSYEWQLGTGTGNQTTFVVYNSTEGQHWGVTGATLLTENSWYMITGRSNNTAGTVYLNGMIDGTDSTAGGDYESNGTAEVHLGDRQTQGADTRWNGSIDEVKIYNISLSKFQIRRAKNESIHGNNLGRGVPALSFHQVEDNEETANTIVNVTRFNETITWLYTNGWNTITYNDYYNWTLGLKTLPEKPIIIVFDDGRQNVYTNATPIMDKYGFVGVMNVVTSYANAGNPLYMDWTAINDLSSKGWQIGSHSVSHCNMIGDCNTTEEWTIEFANSKNSIIGNLSITPTLFVYPFNSNNDTSDTLCATYYTMCSGYSSGYNTYGVFNFKEANLTHEDGSPVGLRRVIFYNSTTQEELSEMIDDYTGLILDTKLNEGTGTTAYDSSGNSLNGAISGATWQNDGVNVTLTSNVDYTQSGSIFTIINPNYAWSGITASWDYTFKRNDSNAIVSRLILTFLALGILSIVLIVVNYFVKDIR